MIAVAVGVVGTNRSSRWCCATNKLLSDTRHQHLQHAMKNICRAVRWGDNQGDGHLSEKVMITCRFPASLYCICIFTSQLTLCGTNALGNSNILAAPPHQNFEHWLMRWKTLAVLSGEVVTKVMVTSLGNWWSPVDFLQVSGMLAPHISTNVDCHQRVIWFRI